MRYITPTAFFCVGFYVLRMHCCFLSLCFSLFIIASPVQAQDGPLVHQETITFSEAQHPFRFLFFEGGNHGLRGHHTEVNREVLPSLNRYVRDGEPLLPTDPTE